MNSKPESVNALHDWILQAGETERRLPRATPAQHTTTWPDTLPDWLAYADDASVPSIGNATSEAVTRFDWLCRVLLQRPEDERRIIWATAHSAAFRARGPAWSRIGRLLHCDRRTAKRRYEAALIHLWYAI